MRYFVCQNTTTKQYLSLNEYTGALVHAALFTESQANKLMASSSLDFLASHMLLEVKQTEVNGANYWRLMS
jgi:hypothetical protein